MKIIDEEVQRIISVQYQRAKELLNEHRSALEGLTRQLLETETVDGAAVKQALVETVKA
jgi:ATP-dependent Zn protease